MSSRTLATTHYGIIPSSILMCIIPQLGFWSQPRSTPVINYKLNRVHNPQNVSNQTNLDEINIHAHVKGGKDATLAVASLYDTA